MAVRSAMAPSMILASLAASPTPMLTTTLVRPATWLMLVWLNSSRNEEMMLSWYLLFSRGCVVAVAITGPYPNAWRCEPAGYACDHRALLLRCGTPRGYPSWFPGPPPSRWRCEWEPRPAQCRPVGCPDGYPA